MVCPKGPDGYIVRDKIYSRYLYEPLSKEELYKRNVGKGIPPGPTAFQSVFTGVGNIFTKALGLQRLLPNDKVKEITPIKEKVDLGLFSELDIFDSGKLDIVDSGDEFEDAPEDAPEDTSQKDFTAFADPVPPGEYTPVIPVTIPPVVVGSHIPQPPKAPAKPPEIVQPPAPRVVPPSPSMPALVDVRLPQAAKKGIPGRGRGVAIAPDVPAMPAFGRGSPIQPASPASPASPAEPINPEILAVKEANVEKVRQAKQPGAEEKVEILLPVGDNVGEITIPAYNKDGDLENYTYSKPADPKDLQKYIDIGKDFAAQGLAQFDRAKAADLEVFAKELGADLSGQKSFEAKKSSLKLALLEKTARQMGLDLSEFRELYTYQTSKGDAHLALAPSTMSKLIDGLGLISDSDKFLQKDLLAYAQINDIPGRSAKNISAEDLRKMVLSHYITSSGAYLTKKEQAIYDPKVLKEYYKVE